MGFFDLNIPYYEADRQVADKSTLKSNRLKLAVKAAELGYTGVAYNRVIKGVMSESDRCSIEVFSLSSFFKLAPALSSSVKFHRDLLNVPVSTPFRQYTRLTVLVDSPAQAAALNSGNPVLKTYDIIAVRPLNQNSFEHACQTAEVDIIDIDFSEKLPFRLKQSMIQAAIKRGVYFEITYSGLLVDAQSRRQMISNAKLLVDWTRRKNLIVSSAAPSSSVFRGPYDVANLLFLFGLPFEHAKAAISKNCRSIIELALRKKHYYKEAIKVEVMPSTRKFSSENLAFGDWFKWDPISSGDGDLLLDDIQKFFSASGSVSNTVNTVRFASALNSLPPQGLHIKEVLSPGKSFPEGHDGGNNLSAFDESQVSIAVHETSAEPRGPNLQSAEGQTSEQIRHQSPGHLDSDVFDLSRSVVNDVIPVEEKSKLAVAMEELRNLKELDECFPSSDAKLYSSLVQCCFDGDNDQVLLPEGNSTLSKDTVPIPCAESAMPVNSVDLVAVDVSVQESKSEIAQENKKNLSFELFDVISNERLRENTHLVEKLEDFVASADVFPREGSQNLIARENKLVSEVELMQEDMLEEQRKIKDPVTTSCQILGKSESGRRRIKRRAGYQHFPFSFKLILNLKPFNKKTRKLSPF